MKIACLASLLLSFLSTTVCAQEQAPRSFVKLPVSSRQETHLAGLAGSRDLKSNCAELRIRA